jgi:hypothetical protein
MALLAAALPHADTNIEVSLMTELNPAERAALNRFERARAAGAAERTAMNLAAWAWLEQRPTDSLPVALQEVTRMVRRGQRPQPRISH